MDWSAEAIEAQTEPWRHEAAAALIASDRALFEIACDGRDMSKHLLPFGHNTSRHALQWALLRAINHGEMERLDWFSGFYNAIIVHIVGDEFHATTPLSLVIGKLAPSRAAAYRTLERLLALGADPRAPFIENGHFLHQDIQWIDERESLLYHMVWYPEVLPGFLRIADAGGRFMDEELWETNFPALKFAFVFPDLTMLRLLLTRFYPPHIRFSERPGFTLTVAHMCAGCLWSNAQKSEALDLLMGAGLRLTPELRALFAPEILEAVDNLLTPAHDAWTRAFRESRLVGRLPGEVQDHMASLASRNQPYSRSITL